MRGNEISQKSFRREIAMTYLKSFHYKPKGRGRKPSNLPGADNARFGQRGHLVIPTYQITREEGAWVKAVLQS